MKRGVYICQCPNIMRYIDLISVHYMDEKVHKTKEIKQRIIEAFGLSDEDVAQIGKTPSDNRAGSNNAGMINKIML